MKNFFSLCIVLFTSVIILSCHKNADTIKKPDPVSYDTDAQKFIDNSGITDTTQKSAINTFVTKLKADSLWTKFVAIYPMVGGSASTTKLNLKDPRDLDGAYRLTFTGNPVFANTGVLFPTINDFADTHLADTATGGYNNSSMSYYSRTQNTAFGYDMGCTDVAVPYNELAIFSPENFDTEWFGFTDNTDSLYTTGLFMLSATPTNVTRYRNGLVVDSKNSAPLDRYTNLTFLIGTSRQTGNSGQKECALATLGNGLTDAQALDFYNIVQNFQTKLNRNK